jgi:HSP20 family protein
MNDKQEVSRTERAQTAPAMLPRVDVIEDAAGITMHADLPGVSKDRLALRVEGETLQIEGDIASETPEGMEPIYAEVQLPRYRRAFTLSRDLDTSRIDAELKDGVLTLRIPKAEHAQPRRVEVKPG